MRSAAGGPGRAAAGRCVGGVARRQRRSTASPDLQKALLKQPELFVDNADGKTADLRARPRRRALRRAGGAEDRARRARRHDYRFSSIGASGIVNTTPFQDEASHHVITKALPRRTFLRGIGATLALPLLDAMVPSMTALARRPRNPCGASATFTSRWAATSRGGRRPAARQARRTSPILKSLAPVKQHVTVAHESGTANAYPGTHATSNAAFLSAARAK